MPSPVATVLSTCGGPTLLMQRVTEPATSCPSRGMSDQALVPQQTQCSHLRNKVEAGRKATPVPLPAYIGTREVLEQLTRSRLPCFTLALAMLCALYSCYYYRLPFFTSTSSTKTHVTHAEMAKEWRAGEDTACLQGERRGPRQRAEERGSSEQR